MVERTLSFDGDLRPTHVVVGGGSAGCVMAARLSENPAWRVLLLEAGPDIAPQAVPDDIRDTYAGHAFNNPAYFWPALTRRAGNAQLRYEQARVLGGGSSINGQVALRGAPRDYERWAELGAAGWGWEGVLPYFRKLEHDRQFGADDDTSHGLHGNRGPIPIDRIEPEHWDSFTTAVTRSWDAMGYTRRRDMNGSFEGGYAAIPLANDGHQRASTAVAYLSESVRRRPNLQIRTGAEVQRLLFEGRRALGIELRCDGGPLQRIAAPRIVLCAGALHTPWLLLRSGIGPASALLERGVPVVHALSGVGQRLQDHPSISLSAYLLPHVRQRPALRHNYVNLVYSSHAAGCPDNDMVMMVVVKSAWHAVGQRLGTLSSYVGKAYSTGSVQLDARDPAAGPEVRFDWLADERDLVRAAASLRFMAELIASGGVPQHATDAFTVAFSDRVKQLGRKSPTNRLLTWTAAWALDSSAMVRRLLIRHVIAGGVDLAELLADETALRRYVREAVTGIWHPCGTCRMGAASDPGAVTAPDGGVHGIAGLSVADASVVPEIPTTNLNLPTIMVAEKMADLMRAAA